MQLPEYKPEQWVVYTLDDGKTHNFGRIVGGSYFADHGKSEKTWHYSVRTGTGDGACQIVSEDAIVATFENEWLPLEA